MNEITLRCRPRRSATRRAAGLQFGLAMLLCGCGDPIYDAVEFHGDPNGVALTSHEDTTRYEWPLTKSGYRIAKPPPMAYLTSFGKPIVVPDPVGAELVPWSEEGLDDLAKRFLHEAYTPYSEQPDEVLTLQPSDYAGLQAFDVSIDGSRLIVIDGQRLALYRTDNGSLVGHLDLPSEIRSSQSPISAVRFAGDSKDILVASADQLYRISGKDKSVIGRCRSAGEPIAQWIVNDDDQNMVVGTESGRLFSGNPDLSYFSALDVGNDLRFNTVALSPDGRRIGVDFNGVPRTYIQDAYQIVDHYDFTDVRTEDDVSISFGDMVDAWVDGDGIVYLTTNQDGTRTRGLYRMFWKPLQITQCSDRPESNYFLTVGQRFVDGHEQLVLFDFGANGRNNSLPTVLAELPQRLACNRDGSRVAIADSRGLHLYHREPWRCRGPIFLSEWTYQWVNEGKFDVIEKLLAILHEQTRLGYGRSHEPLRTIILQSIGYRWQYLSDNEPDSEVLAGLEAWGKQESQYALTCNGFKHYQQAWEARGGGYASEVTEDGFTLYRRHLQSATATLDQAIEMGSPPLFALDTRIQCGLESDEGLDGVDPLCRLATELYPGETEPHDMVSFKLMPQWFGDAGDMLSYMLSVSKMFAAPAGELLYFRYICNATARLDPADKVGWKSYDSRRVDRGVDEFIRQNRSIGMGHFLGWVQANSRARDMAQADKILTYIMQHKAAPPVAMTQGDVMSEAESLYRRAEAIRTAE